MLFVKVFHTDSNSVGVKFRRRSWQFLPANHVNQVMITDVSAVQNLSSGGGGGGGVD